jgi:hypothetical protein
MKKVRIDYMDYQITTKELQSAIEATYQPKISAIIIGIEGSKYRQLKLVERSFRMIAKHLKNLPEGTTIDEALASH